MSPAPGDGDATRRPFLVPFVLGLCSLILVREGLQKLLPDISYWIVFVAGLAVGWVVFTAAERIITKRNATKQEDPQ